LNPWYIDLVEGFVQVFEKQSFIVCFQMQDSQASFFGRHTIVHAACGDLLSLISAPPPKTMFVVLINLMNGCFVLLEGA
jgi:hypothetical protein